MSVNNNKQFGVWMDNHHATVVGITSPESTNFEVIGHIKNTESTSNSNEQAEHNAERMLQQKFFREISSYMVNAEEVHVTGTGTAQEQFMRFLEETPQFKNVMSKETTSNKMSDEKLLEFIGKQF